MVILLMISMCFNLYFIIVLNKSTKFKRKLEKQIDAFDNIIDHISDLDPNPNIDLEDDMNLDEQGK